MSIRLIAMELYRLIKDVEILGKKIEKAPFEKKEALIAQLRKIKAERNRMRRMLDGEKTAR